MSGKKCKHCGDIVREGNSHYCSSTGETYEAGDNRFIVSAIIGGVTDSALLGGLLGGNMLGGVIGDIFGDGDLMD